jgi:hypothetical protein
MRDFAFVGVILCLCMYVLYVCFVCMFCMYVLYVCFVILLIVFEQESSGMVAGTHRAGLCSYVVVDFRLRLARYITIACLGFPLLFRRSVSDVGLGWVGCCACRHVLPD